MPCKSGHWGATSWAEDGATGLEGEGCPAPSEGVQGRARWVGPGDRSTPPHAPQ